MELSERLSADPDIARLHQGCTYQKEAALRTLPPNEAKVPLMIRFARSTSASLKLPKCKKFERNSASKLGRESPINQSGAIRRSGRW
jgi:hypothetical protein